MIEFRFHSLGGQGAVMAAKLLCEVAARGGYHSQSFASYGQARRGQKVEAYVRIGEERIAVRSKMYNPDVVVIMDESLAVPQSTSDMKGDGAILINSPKEAEAFRSLGEGRKIFTMDANRIAMSKGVLLPSGTPVINTTVLGAIAGMIPFLNMEQVAGAIMDSGVPAQAKNVEAAQEAYEQIKRGPGTGGAQHESPEKGEAAAHEGSYPVYVKEGEEEKNLFARCDRCETCYIYCPEHAITFTLNPFAFSINRKACKRCGICIEECPRKMIAWG